MKTSKVTVATLVAVVVLAFASACVEHSGYWREVTPTPSQVSSLDYRPPRDGSGWPSAPLDQPRPFPSEQFTDYSAELSRELGACSWLGKKLLTELGWRGGYVGGSLCMVPLYGGKVLQITTSSSYRTFTDTPDELAFIRPIQIAGLEAREYDLAASADKYPGSCQVAVNTRSITSLIVSVGTAEGAPVGTRPQPQCDQARRAATRIVRTFVPLAGGEPWPDTRQQPDAGMFRERSVCDLIPDLYVYGVFGGVKGESLNGGGMCAYVSTGVLVRVWVATGQNAQDWHTKLPQIGDDDVTEEAPLGEMPGRVRLGTMLDPEMLECARAVFIEDDTEPGNSAVIGVRFAINDEDRTGPERCLIAQETLANLLKKLIDA